MDFIVELPVSQGYDTIAVFVDHDVTKAAVFAPCSTSIMANQTATLYRDYVWKHFGLPRKLISDCGPQFTSSFSTELCKLLDIQQAMSTAYHPQTDGQTECVNQELEQYLCAYCSVCQNDWADHLSTAEFTHNICHHSTINTSPFCALMGYQPTSLPLSTPSSSTPAISDCLLKLSQLRSDLTSAFLIAHQKWTTDITPCQYAIGDKVWLEGKNLCFHQYPSIKLHPRQYGPFPISAVITPVTYKLDLPAQWRIFHSFHASLLSPYHDMAAHGPNFTRPLPDLMDSEDHYEVDSILDSRFFGRSKTLQYLVHWKGYPSSDDQWLPATELLTASDLISSYHLLHPSAPSPTSLPSSSHSTSTLHPVPHPRR